MQMIIQAIEEQETLKAMEFYWGKAKPLLIQDFKVHEWTIYYWSLQDEQVKSDWRISPYMTTLWTSKMI
ncbi:hypothetical protein SAMN05216464_10622 [Mucilaginibacter pineti]|uniref:Uncharacterized protein n=1 Tax=Mucilaginibacter pineti TaxID=1391627 RepID=A0A1G7CMP6_9SPHI|nr:hypothetical protein SAMN05216464_10622 [Mucilaginibacter pineti]